MPQVPPELRSHRATELRGLGSALRDRYVASRAGSHAEVLVERVRNGVATGTTRDYLHVCVPAMVSVAEGDLVETVLSARDVR